MGAQRRVGLTGLCGRERGDLESPLEPVEPRGDLAGERLSADMALNLV